MENVKDFFNLNQKAITDVDTATKDLKESNQIKEKTEEDMLQLEYFEYCILALKDSIVNFLYINFNYLTKEQYLKLCQIGLEKEPNFILMHVDFEFLEKDIEKRKNLYLDLINIAVSSEKSDILNKINFDLLPEKNKKEIYLSLAKKIIDKFPYEISDLKIEYLPDENKKEIYRELFRYSVKKNITVLKYIEPIFFEN